MTLRVIYVSANGFPTSSTDSRGTFSLEHAQALRKLGIKVHALDIAREHFSRDEIDGLKILRLPRIRLLLRTFSINGLKEYFKVLHSIIYERYDCIIFSFFYLKYLPLILLLRAPQRAIVVIAHGGEIMPGGTIRALLMRWMFRLVDVVTPVSEFTETVFSCLVHRRQCDNHRIATIHNGVDLQKLQPTIGREEMRRALGISETEFVVLSISNLVKRKGIDVLIQAINVLASENRAVRHIVIGRGPEHERLMTLASENGNFSRFTFIDAVEAKEIANYYALSDIFALVSTTDWDTGQVEGFGITYAEAMALGKPVIGGSGSGTTTPIKHGITGLLVDPYHPEVVNNVAESIRRFMDDSEFYHRVSEEACRYVAEYFTWMNNANRTKAILESVLSSKSSSARA